MGMFKYRLGLMIYNIELSRRPYIKVELSAYESVRSESFDCPCAD